MSEESICSPSKSLLTYILDLIHGIAVSELLDPVIAKA
jgi:hypothetical protein